MPHLLVSTRFAAHVRPSPGCQVCVAYPPRQRYCLPRQRLNTRITGAGACMVAGGAAPTGLNANVHQGYFAEGLVAAIAAAAGLDVAFPRLAHVIDFSVYRPGPNGTSGSRQIDLQVKSWSTGRLSNDGCFHYPLEVAAFNHLAGRGHDVRHYLVLCLVPPSADDYADVRHDRLLLNKAAYWLSLRDRDPDESLSLDSTKTVLVPHTHLLTPTTIRALVDGDESGAVV